MALIMQLKAPVWMVTSLKEPDLAVRVIGRLAVVGLSHGHVVLQVVGELRRLLAGRLPRG